MQIRFGCCRARSRRQADPRERSHGPRKPRIFCCATWPPSSRPGLPTSSNSCSRRSGIRGMPSGCLRHRADGRLGPTQGYRRIVPSCDRHGRSYRKRRNRHQRRFARGGCEPCVRHGRRTVAQGGRHGFVQRDRGQGGPFAPSPCPADLCAGIPASAAPVAAATPAYAPTRPSAETVNAAYARREAARAESAAAEPEADDAGEEPAPQAPVQEPVKKERNWRSIFKRTLDKINEASMPPMTRRFND